MTRDPLAIHKGETYSPFETVWWSPFFQIQKAVARNVKTSFGSTPMGEIIAAQESLFEEGQRNMHRVFGEIFNNRQMTMPWVFGNNTEPFIDIVENKKGFKIKAEIPGVKDTDLDISIVDGGLMLQGEKYLDCVEQDENYVHKECHAGYFSRTIALPEEADLEQAKANLSLSVLTIDVPKKNATQLKQGANASDQKIDVTSKPANTQKNTKIGIKDAA